MVQVLYGLSGPTAVYRQLASAAERGLVAWLEPSAYGQRIRLYHLTDLGAAVVAIDRGVGVGALVRGQRMGLGHLLAEIPGGEQLLAVYRLLALVVGSGDRPNLVAWQRPWRQPLPDVRRGGVSWLTVPAYAELTWEGIDRTGFLLLPDTGKRPLKSHRPTLRGLARLGELRGARLTLIVQAPAERVPAWRGLIEELGLLAPTTTVLDTRATVLPIQAGTGLQPVTRRALSPRLARSPSAPIPRSVSDGPDRALTTLGRTALRLSCGQLEALEIIAAHAFLTAEQVAAQCHLAPGAARRCLAVLIELGLVEHIRLPSGHGSEPHAWRCEATRDGLRLVAARQGLSLSAAVRHSKLMGGGAAEPVGERARLVGIPAHTAGVNRLFASLASPPEDASDGDGLRLWRSEAAASRWGVFPDGYGVYGFGEQLIGFFLEYDRGGMSYDVYYRKLESYYRYRDSGKWSLDYVTFPWLLFVTTNNGAEKRFAAAACAVGLGRVPLLILVTAEWRVNSQRNPYGLFGKIWRPPEAPFAVRQRWPAR